VNPAHAIGRRRQLFGDPFVALATARVAPTVAQRGQQLGGFGGGDPLLFEELEDAQAIAVAGILARDFGRHGLDAPHRAQQFVGVLG